MDLVLTDFVEDAVGEGPGWVDVGVDLVPAVGKRVASKSVGVVGVSCVVVGKLVMVRGGEHICDGVNLEVFADVAEDDGVEHDVFVCSAGVRNLGNGKCDALGERWSGASAERGLELGRARVMVRGNHGITRGGGQELKREGGEAWGAASRGERRGTAGTQRVPGGRRTA